MLTPKQGVSTLLLAPLLLARPATATASDAPKISWFDYSYVTSGFNFCNNATSTCRSLGHWVFSASASSASDSFMDTLVVGSSFQVDGGDWTPSTRGNFEAHFVNGQCANTSDAGTCIKYEDNRAAQVWNIAFDQIRQFGDTSPLPQVVCAKVFVQNERTGVSSISPKICTPFTTNFFDIKPAGALESPDMMYSQSADAFTILCTDSTCRVNGHISIDFEVPDPTDELLGVTEVSNDGGNWSSASTNTFFEQKVKHVDGKWYHTVSFNYDDNTDTSHKVKEMCIRMSIQNLVHRKTYQVDFGTKYGNKDRYTRCLPMCSYLTQFSHAVDAGGYCPPTQSAASLMV